MTDLRKAAKMALDALDSCEFDYDWEERPYKTFDEDLVNGAVDALRQALAEPEPWDTSDMAHRTGGLTVEQSIALEMGIDRGAWSDVQDATKWVDELRGDEDSEQEPVAHWDGSAPLIIEPHPLFKKREWVSLTDVEWMNIVNKNHAWYGYKPEDVAHEVFKLTEAALKEKNGL